MPKKSAATSGSLPKRGIDHRQGENDERAGQHEEQAGGKAAAPAMQRPAGIGRELHRFRARQQHAEIERRQISSSLSHFSLIDEDAVHQGDLAGRPAEGEAGRSSPRRRVASREDGA